jgi:SAM-dependent methyltransferase
MPRPFHAPDGAGEILARQSFLEPLLAGRRVLEVGAVARTGGASARDLAARGATVTALDEDADAIAAAAAAAGAAITWRAGRPSDLERGAFDLVLFHDGARLAASPDEVAELAALLADGGHLAAALPVPGAPALSTLAGLDRAGEAPGYESFVGALAAVFPAVEIATQSAAVGWVLAAVGDPEPELSVDGSHGGAPDAAAFLAVCGAAPCLLSGMCLVTLPVASLLAERAAAAAAVERAVPADEAVRAALAAAHVASASAEARLDEVERRAADAAADLARVRALEARAEERARDAERERGRAEARAAALEAELAQARTAQAAAVAEREAARREAEARAREARAWADAMGRLERRIDDLETAARSHAAEAETAQTAAARAIAEASEARALAEAARFEADALRARAEGAEAELRRVGEDLRAAAPSRG